MALFFADIQDKAQAVHLAKLPFFPVLYVFYKVKPDKRLIKCTGGCL